MKETIKISDIAKMIGKGQAFVREMLDEPGAPKRLKRLGKPYRYDKSEIERYFFSQ